MHKDQKRIQNTVLPHLMLRAHQEDPEAVRDCMVVNRLFNQGPDPLYLMEAAPYLFADLCTLLKLDVRKGREAIEAAHEQGPGVLLDGEGLPNDAALLSERMTDWHGGATLFDGLPEPWRLEMLWLLLAHVSDCVEEGYSEDTTLTRRIYIATRAAVVLAEFVRRTNAEDAVTTARHTMSEFERTAKVWTDEAGHPHTDAGHGFYILYKQGHKCVAVHTPTCVFWGTTPDTSLAEQGVEVDEEISPQFGIARVQG